MRARPVARRILSCERLEDRRCLASTVPPPDQPAPRFDPYGVLRHGQDLAEAALNNAAVVFYGDSITDFFADGAGRKVWSRRFAPLRAVDFGVAYDWTSTLLGRVETGEVETSAKVAVVMIGSNNLVLGDSPSATAGGVEAVVRAIRAESPGTRVLLLGVLPRDSSAADDYAPEVLELNADVAKLADGDAVQFLDLSTAFAEPDGTINLSLTLDGVHPNAAGYQAWANAMSGTLTRMLKEPDLLTGASPAKVPARLALAEESQAKAASGREQALAEALAAGVAGYVAPSTTDSGPAAVDPSKHPKANAA